MSCPASLPQPPRSSYGIVLRNTVVRTTGAVYISSSGILAQHVLQPCVAAHGLAPRSYGLVLRHTVLHRARAMAPKAKSKAASQLAPTILAQDFKISIEDVSTEEDSGWRQLDDERVLALQKIFLSGQWGVNIMTKPSVLSEHGNPVMAQNGARKVCDGKHTFAALKECKKKWEAAGDDPDADEDTVWTDALIDVFTNGVSVYVYQFNDMGRMKAFCVAAHDESNNTYKPTNVHDLWQLVNDYRQTVPGGCWQKTQQALYALYGKQSMFVYRMMQIAMTLTENICKRAGELNIPNAYIHENCYFVGHGAEASKRMGDKFRLLALEMLYDDRALGRGLSTKVFLEEYCAPLHKAEKWLIQMKKQFGHHAESPAFRRVEEFLGGSRARLSILACMKTNLPLHGVSEDQPGIEQCRVLFKELEASLTRKPQDGQGQDTHGLAAAGAGSDQGAAQGGQVANGLDAGVSPGGSVGNTMVIDEEEDVVAGIVRGKVEAALMKINYYPACDQLESVLKGIIMSTHNVVFIVDAPSSKPRVLVNLIDWTVKLIQQLPCGDRIRLLIPVGQRLDLLSAVESRSMVVLPNLLHFCIQLNSGDEQKVRKKAGYMHYACSPQVLGQGSVPCSIPAQATRAGHGECTRLRCLDSQCPFRPQDEKTALMPLDGNLAQIPANSEIPAEDREHENVDAHMQDDSSAPDKDPMADVLAQLLPPSGRRDCIVDLWPFAFGKEFYKALIDGVAANESLDHMVVMTTSAHPSLPLAGHDRHMNVHVLLDRVKEHSKRHGEAVLKGWLTQSYDAVERKKVDPAQKRLRNEDLYFVTIPAPETQPVHFVDVPTDSASWRAGINCIPDSDVLEKGILDLVAKELTDHHLSVGLRKGRHVLVTNRALKEGAVICPGSALLFSTADHIREFLNTSFHAALSASPLLTIEGLDTAVKKRSMSVHAVLVGACRLVTDFRGFRKWSNCSFRVNPAAGANDQFLSLVVQTHNGCGVAAGSEIMADLGEGYVPGHVGERPLSKKFKGALEALFEKQRSDCDDGNDNGLDAAAKQKANGLDAASKAAKGAGTASTAAGESAASTAAATSAASTAAASTAASTAAASTAAASKSASTAAAASSTAASSTAASSVVGKSATEVLGKYNTLQAVFKDGQVRLLNSSKTGTKIPPQTIILTIDQGRLTNPTPAKSDIEIPFQPTPKAPAILKTGAKMSKVTTFADIIKEQGCSALYQHHGFAKGASPAAFSVKKPTVMAPAREDVAKALMQQIKNKSAWQWTWIVENQKEKVMPVAVAVTNKNQVIVKGNSTDLL